MRPFANWKSAGAAAGLLLTGLALSVVIVGGALAQALTPNYRDTDLRQVIEAVGAVTGRNFLVDPRVRAQVTLISNTPMTADAFYEAFLATLSVHGFVAIESGDVVRIVPDANARQMPGALPGAAVADDLVTQVVRLENVASAQLVPILRPLIPQYGHLAAHQTSNMLIIVDRASNLQRMLDIVRSMDRAATEDVEVIRLENAFAGEVVRTLSTLNQAAQAAGGAPMVQAIADDRTNSVLLSGSEPGRLRFRGLIAYLDAPSQSGGDSRVRYLNYTDAESLASKLQAQFSGVTPQPGEAPSPSGDGGVTIWADQATNALVINAPARVMQDMMSVVDKIDIPRLQVLVEAIIVEVSEEKAAELGVSWIADGSGGSSILGLTNFGSTTPGIVQLGAASAGDTPSASAIPEGIVLGLGRIRDTGTSWAALVSALSGDASTNVISKPRILALDNEEAEITVGQEVPFLTGQFTNTGAAAGSINPFQTIQRQEVGTRLRIVPQINEGTGVKLTIEQETSSISAGAAGAVDLVTNNRTITTSVFIDDGGILVLGGLMDDRLLQGEQRVPGLGRIPGLGWLFRARNTERVKTNLMVFIRPTILRDSAQASFETNAKYNFIRELQRQQAEQPVRLMRNETYPLLPELPETEYVPTPPPASPPQSQMPD